MTLSVPTVPDAEELSPYEIFHEEPWVFLKVVDFEESKTVCPVVLVEDGSSVDQS